GIVSAGYAVTYYKTKHIEYSMGVHILNNSISVLLSLFV
ncbi:MAG: CPBP family intramembrane glutamate endopeptidase, partial [Streptococcus sp.]